jgi:hypothetical protein
VRLLLPSELLLVGIGVLSPRQLCERKREHAALVIMLVSMDQYALI